MIAFIKSVLGFIADNWKPLVLAALVAAAGYGGWEFRGDHEAAKQVKAAQAWQKLMDAEVARGNKLAADLETEKQNIKTVTVEVIRRVPEVTTVYVEVPGETPKAIPDAVFTRGFVGLWNDALAADLSGAAGKPADPPAETYALVRARINQADVLTNHTINAGRYAECRAQLNKLIDWHEGRSATLQK